MNRYMTSLKGRAASNPQKIVLPESGDLRILQAADRILADGLAIPVLIGKGQDIQELALRYQLDLEGAELIYPKDHASFDRFAKVICADAAGIGDDHTKKAGAFYGRPFILVPFWSLPEKRPVWLLD